ncbi:MAG: ABC transporter permease [Paucibacter sp.]|nr:ABC transporter permease [Roseateles sp.]
MVLGKETVDALRDRRTLLRMMMPAVLMGPLVLFMISTLISSLEERAERREILAIGMDHAPTLRNYLERQTYTIKPAPADYEAQLRASRLLSPVLEVDAQFEDDLLHGKPAGVTIVSDSVNQRAQAGAAALRSALEGFQRERSLVAMALRGISPELLKPLDIAERDLASTQARATQLTGMVPMFIIMAVLYGALTAALDSTAGERERGSLEPLLMNPVPPMTLVAGKWGAVTLLGLAVALLSNLSFLSGQVLIRNDELQAMFHFGWIEVLRCFLLELPLACSMSALLMAVAIRTKTFKEAQTSSTLIMTLIGLAPMVTLMNPGAEAPWYFWVPGLGQNALMMLVLKGESLPLAKVLPSVLSGLGLTLLGLSLVAQSMRRAVAQ